MLVQRDLGPLYRLGGAATAERVFCRPDFTLKPIKNVGVRANSLYVQCDGALDALGNLYMADSGSSRWLKYDWALAKV